MPRSSSKAESAATGTLASSLRVKTEPALWREGVTDSRNRESLRLLAASLDSISDAVSITNDEHLFVYANQSFLRLYGYRRDEVLAHLDLMLNFSTVSQTLVDEVRTYTALGGWHGQLNNRHKTGKGVAVALRTSVLRDARGLFLGHLGIAAPQARREELERQIAAFLQREGNRHGDALKASLGFLAHAPQLGTPSAAAGPKLRLPPELSLREREIFLQLGQGLATKEIAETLGVSIHTVHTHRSHIREKLRLADNRQLVKAAIAWTRGAVG